MSQTLESRTLGITSPISLAEPKESDIKASLQLESCLRSYDLFESELEMQHRMNVLSKLNELLQNWIKEVSAKKMPKQNAELMSGKIFTFGSYRLGVHTKGLINEYINNYELNYCLIRCRYRHIVGRAPTYREK
jgi:poly(A) polymerase